MYYAALILGAVLVAAFMIVRVRVGGVKALLLKTAASFLFIAAAFAAMYRAGVDVPSRGYGGIIICGLICGLLGDVYLDLKWVYEKDADTYLFTGFSCFGVGHIFFAWALLRYMNYAPWCVIVAVVAAVIMGVGVFFGGRLLGLDTGRFRLISAVYGGVMAFAAALAAAMFLYDTTQYAALVFALGGLMFILSDFVLSFSYFKQDSPRLVIVNHTFYYLAQYIIASSILFIK